MTKETTKKIIKIESNTRYRVSVFRSNKTIYAQIIDDKLGATIASMSSLKIKDAASLPGKAGEGAGAPASAGSGMRGKKTPSEIATLVGETLGKDAIEKKINKVTYDRGKYRYHGRVKALAEGLRKAGLLF